MPPAWLLKLATGRNVMLALAAWLTFSLLLFSFGPYQTLRNASGSLELLEETFGYTAKEGYARIFILGEAGRALYENFQWLDFVNVALTFAALTLALIYVFKRLFPVGHPVFWLVWLPAVTAAGEWVENVSLLALIWLFPREVSWLVDLTSIATQFKLAVASASLPVLALACAQLVAQKFRRRTPSSND